LGEQGCSDRAGRLQAGAAPKRRALPTLLLAQLTLLLTACGNQNPVMTPVGWWHDLQGGEIAATRPPPPGGDLPYPKLGTIPPKPILPSENLRVTLRDQLAQQRDAAERLAAARPIDTLPPPPPPPPASAAPPADTANATLPGAEAAPRKPQAASAAATTPPAPAPDGGPAPGTAVTLAGAPADQTGLPDIPEAPPPPASFESTAALPAPTPPPPLPAPVPSAFLGNTVLFATGSAVLDPSQTETVKGAAAKRGKGHIDVEGHGDALADSPEAQLAAIDLGLKRAQAVAEALEKQHVPAEAIRLSATPFGRGASLRVAS